MWSDYGRHNQVSGGLYDISHDNPNRWLVLAFVLATESGKITARPAHAPIKWDAFTDVQLCERVFAAKAQIAEETGCEIDGVPDIKACRRIRDDHPEWYKTNRGRVSDASTQYQVEMLHAFEALAARINQIVHPPDGNVVKLRT
jgi:hypothetical protein